MSVTLPPAIKEELYRYNPEGSWVLLLRVELNDGEVLHLCGGDTDVSYDGETWRAWPMEFGGLDDEPGGQPTELEITVANPIDVVSRIMHQNRGLVERRATVLFYNDAADDVFLWGEFKVMNPSYSRQGATFTLGFDSVMAFQFPGGIYNRRQCRWREMGLYRHATTCQYDGELPTCSGSFYGLNGCAAHDNVRHFGGFPGIPADETGDPT